MQHYFGGPEGGIEHWGPHGGVIDTRGAGEPEMIIAMSDQQSIKRLSLDGKLIDEIHLPGSNPRMIQIVGEHLFVPHLADNWPQDRDSRGYVSVLDRHYRILSNIGATSPEYIDGKLQPMHEQGGLFQHPHDLVVASDGAIYVPQFASGNTYPGIRIRSSSNRHETETSVYGDLAIEADIRLPATPLTFPL